MRNRKEEVADGLIGLRRRFHERLCSSLLSRRDGRAERVLNIADADQAASVELADAMLAAMKLNATAPQVTPQRLGSEFAQSTADFLSQGLQLTQHLHPAAWIVCAGPAQCRIANFAQYAHLASVEQLLNEHPDLRATFGGDYIVTPDITIARPPLGDEELNRGGLGLSAEACVGRRSPLRQSPEGVKPTLHASISMKWTMRSDRAQNTRTEALNLIRNRKGRAPHIAVVTFEPLPSRLASIAMGTGDVDCTYHVALHELLAGARRLNRSEQFETLKMLVTGERLRDISDLVLDLSI